MMVGFGHEPLALALIRSRIHTGDIVPGFRCQLREIFQ
jgi:hypothetical protein